MSVFFSIDLEFIWVPVHRPAAQTRQLWRLPSNASFLFLDFKELFHFTAIFFPEKLPLNFSFPLFFDTIPCRGSRELADSLDSLARTQYIGGTVQKHRLIAFNLHTTTALLYAISPTRLSSTSRSFCRSWTRLGGPSTRNSPIAIQRYELEAIWAILLVGSAERLRNKGLSTDRR